MSQLYKFGGWNGSEVFNEKACLICTKMYKPKSGAHKFCSPQCKGKWQYVSGRSSTENQYKSISGNWYKYFNRLCNQKDRENLTPEILVDLLEEQDGLCALSGEKLTCTLQKGFISKTNASIDQIIPSGGYSKDNIQLVCRALNCWRGDTDLNEFIDWCTKVAKHNNGGKVDAESIT